MQHSLGKTTKQNRHDSPSTASCPCFPLKQTLLRRTSLVTLFLPYPSRKAQPVTCLIFKNTLERLFETSFYPSILLIQRSCAHSRVGKQNFVRYSNRVLHLGLGPALSLYVTVLGQISINLAYMALPVSNAMHSEYEIQFFLW